MRVFLDHTHRSVTYTFAVISSACRLAGEMPMLCARIRRAVIVAALTTSALAAGSAAAVALDMMAPTANSVACSDNPEGGPVRDPGNCRTENRTWTWYPDSSGEFELETPDRVAARDAMIEWESFTVMNQVYDGSPEFSGGAETDVIFQEGYVPGAPATLAGITWCVDIVDGSPNVCDSFYIRVRGAGTYNKWLAAHESGHALGLTHGREAAPRTAESNDILGIMTAGELPSRLGPEPRRNVDGTY